MKAPMGARRKQKRLLELAASDRTFEQKELDGAPILEGKCIHCRKKLALHADGTPLNGATLEHIVPKHHGGTDALENLAIARARERRRRRLR